MIKSVTRRLEGAQAIVIGCSNIVGKPMARMLVAEGCTVTMAHSKTRQLDEVVRTSDIVVAAAGRQGLVRGQWLKPGAIVIDVGINRALRDGQPIIVGDVAFDEAIEVAGAITPVPGGVGPMTIACLLNNAVLCAENGVEVT